MIVKFAAATFQIVMDIPVILNVAPVVKIARVPVPDPIIEYKLTVCAFRSRVPSTNVNACAPIVKVSANCSVPPGPFNVTGKLSMTPFVVIVDVILVGAKVVTDTEDCVVEPGPSVRLP